MFFRLLVDTKTIRFGTGLDLDGHPTHRGRRFVSADVTPESDQIRLASGEVFSWKSNGDIGGSIYIRDVPEAEMGGRMSYLPAWSTDEEHSGPYVFFDFSIGRSGFDELMKNLRSGLRPESLSVTFNLSIDQTTNGPLRYGSLPDELEWTNVGEGSSREVSVSAVEFLYDVREPAGGSDTHEHLGVIAKNVDQIKSVAFAFLAFWILTSLASLLGKLF